MPSRVQRTRNGCRPGPPAAASAVRPGVAAAPVRSYAPVPGCTASMVMVTSFEEHAVVESGM